ncbi:hypothetical protein KC686_01160 [Candidatus Woesebacteria bacterium]|nr:hypothetical protein [Candidatus Woesebacteria bacterium]
MHVRVASVTTPDTQQTAARITHFSFQGVTVVFAYAIEGEEAAQLAGQVDAVVTTKQCDSAETLYECVSDIVSSLPKNVLFSCAGLLSTKKRVVCCSYKGQVQLLRDGQSKVICPESNEIQLLQGAPKMQDAYILLTRKGKSVLESILARTEQGYDARVAVESLAVQVRSAQQVVACSAVVYEDEAGSTTPPTTPTVNQSNQQRSSFGKKTSARHSAPAKHSGVTSLFKRWFHPNSLRRLSYKKLIIWLLVISSLLLLLGRYILFSQDEGGERRALENTVGQLQIELSKVPTLQNENPTDARKKVDEVIEQLQSLKEQYSDDGEIQAYLTAEIEKASQLYERLEIPQEVQGQNVFFDFTQTSSAFVATNVARSGNTLFALDRDRSAIIRLDAQTKQAASTLLETQSMISISADENGGYVLAEDIFAANTDGDLSLSRVLPKDDNTTGARLIAVYNQSLYVLNSEKRNIYRYTSGSTGYGTGTAWVTSAQGLEFATITDMVVDGSVWLATDAGGIYKLEGGSDTGLQLSGMLTPFSGRLQLYTDSATEFVYVLEPSSSRLVTLRKNGAFVKEITNEVFATASDVVVDEDTGRVYVANGSALYDFALE